MGGEWELVEIGDVAAVRSGYAFRSSDWTESGIPVVKIANVKGGRLEMTSCSFVSESTAAQAGEFQLTEGDILIAMTGYIGDVARVQKTDLPCVLNQRVGKFTVKDPKRLDESFLYTFLSWSETRQKIEGLGYGSAQPNVSPSLIHKVELRLPPLPIQRRIADILGTLDDKIELNRRMNATLEDMARTLFKSWFVDFDPVRAKMDGRQPEGMDAETAALFPDGFEDSELGEVPRGWGVSNLGTKLVTVLGGTPSRAKPEYWTNGTVPWINSGKTNEFRIIEPSEYITKDAVVNSSTKLLPSRTTVLAITGATLGQVSITEIECCANQSVVAIIATEEFPTEFIYPWINENIGKLIASQTGGAQQHINKGNVEDLLLICPNHQIVEEYYKKVKPLFDQIAANCFQSSTLSTLRDTLLPKLMGGEVGIGITKSNQSK